jgi:hypothetical protein
MIENPSKGKMKCKQLTSPQMQQKIFSRSASPLPAMRSRSQSLV